ncbi:MAG: DUF4127 family protein [Acidobacteriota bacterium]
MTLQRALSSWTVRLVGALLISQIAGWTHVPAQQRPKLRPVRRDYFAGKFLLIPPDSRPVSIQVPRLIARLADHDIVLPPIDLLGDAAHPGNTDRIVEWAKEFDYADVEGVIISLEMMTKGGAQGALPDEAASKGRLALIDSIRNRNKGVAVYGLVGETQGISTLGLDLAAAGKLDFLLVCRDADSANLEQRRSALVEEIARRGIAGRVTVTTGMAAGPQLLVARLLNHRFGLTPKLWIGTSSSPQAASLAPLLLSQISAIDGRALPGTPEAASRSDVVLFVNAPDTEDEGQTALLSTVASAITKGFKVALVDLSESAASREALLTELRRRKMLDQIIGYSANERLETASASVIAQAASRLVTMRFLRDDVDRLQRAERAQVELMLTRVLSEVSYQSTIRPKLEAFLRDQLKVDPQQISTVREQAELFAREEASRVAGDIFREQYFRNTHSILLSTGERAVYELRTLQRMQARFSWGTIDEVELRAGVFVPLVSIVPPEGNRNAWDLLDAAPLDNRVVKRFDAVYWPGLKTDVEQVSVQISLNRREMAAESFTIQSRRRSKIARRIEIASSSAVGAFYALGRLEQLGLEGRLAEDFTLTEKPAFVQRGVLESSDGIAWSHRDRLDMIRFLGRTRMNRYYFSAKGESLNREKWREPYSESDLDRFRELALEGEENFVTVVYCLSPGRTIKYSSDDDFRLLAGKLSSLYSVGVRHFLLRFDDSPETLEQPQDRDRFKSAAAAQTFLANRTYEHLKGLGKGFDLSVTPGKQVNRAGHDDYLRELGTALVPDVGVVWPAKDVSASAEAAKPGWRDLTGHRNVILDGFPSNDGMAWRPFLGAMSANASDLDDAITGIIAGSISQAHVSMIPLATVADYLWEPGQYNPGKSLDQALKLLFDNRTAAAIKMWSDVYGEDRWHAHLFSPLFKRQPGEVDVPEIERTLGRLEEVLDVVGLKRESGLMRGELILFVRRTRLALRRLTNDPAYERLPDARYRLRSD